MRLWPGRGSQILQDQIEQTRASFPIDNLPAPVSTPDTDDVLSAVFRTLQRSTGESPSSRYRFRGQNPQEDLIRRLLPILDGFDQVFRFGERDQAQGDESLQNWLKALKGIHRHLVSVLEKEGLKPIETIGRKLDLDRHEVVDVRETLEASHDTILEEVDRGYELNGRVLRDARVIVARRPS